MNLSAINPGASSRYANRGTGRRNTYKDYVGRTSVTATDPAAKNMAVNGRYGDTMMAHVTPGELVVPIPAQTPEVIGTVRNEMARKGLNFGRYVVGSGQNSINPNDGAQEHFSLGKIGKILGTVGKVASVVTGNPLFAMGGELASGLSGGAGGGGGGGSSSGAPNVAAMANLPAPNAASIASETAANSRPSSDIRSSGQVIPDMSGDTSGGTPSALDDLSARSPESGGGFDLNQAAGVLQLLTKALGGDGGIGGTPEFFDANAPRAYNSNSMNPRTGAPEFYVDEQYYGTGRNQREQDIQKLGYDGPFGRGVADQWLTTRYGTTDLSKINTSYQSPTPAAANNNPAPAPASPAPATTPAPAASTSGATKTGNDGYYDLYKPGGSEIRVVSIRPGTQKTRNGVSKIDYAANDDLVTLSDGRTVLANTLKGPNGDYRISTGQIINPTSNTVIGGAAPRNDMKGFDYYYPGNTPYAASPAPASAPAATPAPAANTPAPAAGGTPAPAITPYYEPQYLNEYFGRQIGYQGPWGAGGMAAWEKANPAKSAELARLVAQYGGNQPLTPDLLARLNPQQAEEQVPTWLQDIIDRVNELTAAQTPTTTGTGTTTGTNTSSAQPEEPTITRVSPLNPTRSRRFGSRRYRGSLARNF